MPRKFNQLTPLKVANLIKNTTKPCMFNDGGGLHLMVRRKGEGSWCFRFKWLKKPKLMGLGPTHTVSLAEARIRAKQARQLILDGKDPLAVKHDAKAAAKIEAARAMNFAQAVELFLQTDKIKKLSNDKHRAQWRTTLEETFPAIGDLPVAAIDTPILVNVLRPIWDRAPETASRLRGRIESVLAWCTVQEFRQGDNPAKWKNHLDHVFTKPQVEHQPSLPFTKMPSLMTELRKRDSVSARALEFLILTVGDVAPVIKAKWSDVDFEGLTWTCLVKKSKHHAQAREHVVPLCPRAVEILQALPRVSDFVFSNGGGKPISSAAMPELIKPLKLPSTTPRRCATVKGFRSSFRDWAGERTKFDHETIEFAMRHNIPNKAEASYRRYRGLDKRTLLMNEWCEYCGGTA